MKNFHSGRIDFAPIYFLSPLNYNIAYSVNTIDTKYSNHESF